MAKRHVSMMVAVTLFAVLTIGNTTGVAAQRATVTNRMPVMAGVRQNCPNNDCSLVFPASYESYVLTYPSGSKEMEYHNISLHGLLQIFSGSLDDSSTSLDEFTQSFMDIIASDPSEPGYQLLAPIQKGMLGGASATTFAYTANDATNGARLNTRFYITLHNGYYYLLEFYAAPNYSEAYFNSLGSLLNSFQFT